MEKNIANQGQLESLISHINKHFATPPIKESRYDLFYSYLTKKEYDYETLKKAVDHLIFTTNKEEKLSPFDITQVLQWSSEPAEC